MLRLLPRSYRDVWEEDMVATFLSSMHTDDHDDADYLADFGRPGWSEVASVAMLAIRLRIGTAGAPPRYAAWGEAIRLSVLAGMLVNAAASVVGVFMTLWLAGMIPFVEPPILPEPPGYPVLWHRINLFTSLAGALWLPAFLALIAGRWAAGRWLGSAAAGVAVASAVLITVTGQRISREVGYTILLNVLLVLAMAAVHSGRPKQDRRSWFAALGFFIALFTGHVWLLSEPERPLAPLDWAGLESLVILVAVTVHLSGQARHRFGRFSVWTPTLALIAYPVLGLRLVTLLDFADTGSAGWHPAVVTLGIAEAVAVAAAAMIMTLLSFRALRRLPTTAADASAWSTPSR